MPMQGMSVIKAALDLASTGSYLIPEVVDGAIRDYTAKEAVLYNAVTHVPWATNTYYIRKRTAIPTVSWSTDGAALPAAQRSTFAKVSKSVKYIYARGEVTGPMQRAAGSLFNALALEIEAHSRALVEQLSADIATGDASNDEIEGILHQADAANDDLNAGGAELDVSGESDPTLSLNMLDRAIDNSRGQVDLIVTSRKVRRKINALLQAQQQFVDRVEIQAGFRVLAYDGIPIVTDLNWEDNTKAAFIRRADAKLLVHQDFTYEELAKTKDSQDFMIKGYFGFALEGRPTVLLGFDTDGVN